MPRMVFNFLAIVSGLLCIFLIYSCLRSFLPARVRYEPVDGSLMIIWWEGQIPSDPDSEMFNPGSEKFCGTRSLLKIISRDSETHRLGFTSITGDGIFRGQKYHIVGIPYWVLIPPTAILPILWLIYRGRHRDRRKVGHCKSCGYDLRESKEKCPECGAAIATVATST